MTTDSNNTVSADKSTKTAPAAFKHGATIAALTCPEPAAPSVPTSKRAALTPASSPEEIALAIKRTVHTGWGGSCVAGVALVGVYGDRDIATDVADATTFEVFKEVQPRGQLERMMCEQLVLLHGQALAAHGLAATARDPIARERALNSASRLLGDFRKTLGAIQTYRHPPQPMIIAKQANLAQNQVVVNGDVAPNELRAFDA